MSSNKCPFCGSSRIDALQVNNGTSYVLTTVDNSYTPPHYNTSGIPVVLIGCRDCKGIHIICPSLK